MLAPTLSWEGTGPATPPALREGILILLSATTTPDTASIALRSIASPKRRYQFHRPFIVGIFQDPHRRTGVRRYRNFSPDPIQKFPANLRRDIFSFQQSFQQMRIHGISGDIYFPQFLFPSMGIP
jgi:hypothetical protein